MVVELHRTHNMVTYHGGYPPVDTVLHDWDVAEIIKSIFGPYISPEDSLLLWRKQNDVRLLYSVHNGSYCYDAIVTFGFPITNMTQEWIVRSRVKKILNVLPAIRNPAARLDVILELYCNTIPFLTRNVQNL